MIRATGNNFAPTAAASLHKLADDASGPDRTAPNGTTLARAGEAVDRRFAQRPIRTASSSAGFFTLGIAIAVLAAGLLVTGTIEELDVAQSASAPAPTEEAGERRQPAASVKTEGGRNVVIGEAPSGSPNRAAGDATSPR
jgi:hypothetical protein